MSMKYRKAMKINPEIDPRTFCQVKCTMEEKRTKQSEADACDINKIMARYINTGRLPEYIKQNPQFGDFSNVQDYQESLNLVKRAELQFSLLPSKVRERCQNDPGKFLEFVADPANAEALIEMRLATPKAEAGAAATEAAYSRMAETIAASMVKLQGSSSPASPAKGAKQDGGQHAVSKSPA